MTSIHRYTQETRTPEKDAQINALLPKVSSSGMPLSREDMTTLIASSFVFVADDSQAGVVGMATLAEYYKPSGHVGMVEDVVVADGWEGKGLGTALMQKVIEQARTDHLKSVALTSRPSRERARALYERMGFELRDTGYFRLTLTY